MITRSDQTCSTIRKAVRAKSHATSQPTTIYRLMTWSTSQLDWKDRRPRAFEDAVEIRGCAAEQVQLIHAIRN